MKRKERKKQRWTNVIRKGHKAAQPLYRTTTIIMMINSVFAQHNSRLTTHHTGRPT